MTLFDYYFGNTETTKMVENDNEFILSILSPGRELADFKVEVKNNKLIISAEKKTSSFSFSSFKKLYELPDNVDADKITATYKAGILELKVPKSEEAKKSLVIEVRGE